MNKVISMFDDLITPENLSKSLLKSVFDGAFMDVLVDEDGDLLVKEDITCFILISENSKDKIRLLTLFGINPTVNPSKVLECVNTINSTYVMTRAFSDSIERLAFDYHIYIKGGITKKNLVLAVKYFCSIPRQAVEECARDILG